MRPLGFLFFIFFRTDFGVWYQNTTWKTSSTFNKTSEHTFAGCRCQQMKTWDLIIVFLAGRLRAFYLIFFFSHRLRPYFWDLPTDRGAAGTVLQQLPPRKTWFSLYSFQQKRIIPHFTEGFYFPVGAAGMVEAEGARWNLTRLNVSI